MNYLTYANWIKCSIHVSSEIWWWTKNGQNVYINAKDATASSATAGDGDADGAAVVDIVTVLIIVRTMSTYQTSVSRLFSATPKRT